MTQFRSQNLTVLGLILMLTAGAALSASNDGKSSPQSEALCSDAWYQFIEKKVPTGDGQGHGPDLGSDEWKSNDCWKSADQPGCVRDEYQRRIAELQARYRLVPGKGPVRFRCDGSPANEVVVTFFQTDPPTLMAERGNSVSLMYLQPSGSGTW